MASAASQLLTVHDTARSNADLMQRIAKGSREQAAAIEEVNAAVRQMNEMTQYNAAHVEVFNAAMEQTEWRAAELDRIVGLFRISPSTGTPRNEDEPTHSVNALRNNATHATMSLMGQGSAALETEVEPTQSVG